MILPSEISRIPEVNPQSNIYTELAQEVVDRSNAELLLQDPEMEKFVERQIKFFLGSHFPALDLSAGASIGLDEKKLQQIFTHPAYIKDFNNFLTGALPMQELTRSFGKVMGMVGDSRKRMRAVADPA